MPVLFLPKEGMRGQLDLKTTDQCGSNDVRIGAGCINSRSTYFEANSPRLQGQEPLRNQGTTVVWANQLQPGINTTHANLYIIRTAMICSVRILLPPSALLGQKKFCFVKVFGISAQKLMLYLTSDPVFCYSVFCCTRHQFCDTAHTTRNVMGYVI